MTIAYRVYRRLSIYTASKKNAKQEERGKKAPRRRRDATWECCSALRRGSLSLPHSGPSGKQCATAVLKPSKCPRQNAIFVQKSDPSGNCLVRVQKKHDRARQFCSSRLTG